MLLLYSIQALAMFGLLRRSLSSTTYPHYLFHYYYILDFIKTQLGRIQTKLASSSWQGGKKKVLFHLDTVFSATTTYHIPHGLTPTESFVQTLRLFKVFVLVVNGW